MYIVKHKKFDIVSHRVPQKMNILAFVTLTVLTLQPLYLLVVFTLKRQNYSTSYQILV